MRCPDCKTEVTGESVFCHRCGAALSPDVADANMAPADDTSGPGNELPAGAELLKQRAAAARDSGDDPEEELWQGTYSSRAMIGQWLAAACATVISPVIAIMTGIGGTGWLILIAAILLLWIVLYLWLLYRQLSVRYRLTTQRFGHETGLLWRVTDRVEVIDMDDITFQQGPVQRLLGVGTIRITSSDRTHPELKLYGIDRVKEVATAIDDARRLERVRRGLHIEAV